MGAFLGTRIIEPIVSLLRQGVTPEKIALSLALGFTLGIFPILGVTTVMCIAAAAQFRLNLVAIQLANWIAYPLQILLIVPFFAMGAALFGTDFMIRDTASLVTLMRSDFFYSLKLLGNSSLKAILLWALSAPFIIMLLYGTVTPILKVLMKNLQGKDLN